MNTDPSALRLKQVKISLRSRVIVRLIRWFLRPWMAWLIRGSDERIGRTQLKMAAMICKDSSGLPVDYRVIGVAGGAAVPGHVLGDLGDTGKPVVLYLHGGAFIIPTVPMTHVTLVSRLCRELAAVGFLPDYRLAPANKYPAALDDCEQAYRALLELGFDPARIVVAGESAGGNLLLGLLQRIRRNGLPMPRCAVPISPATEMGRIHAPPARALLARRDAILPIGALVRVSGLYAGDADTADPELSPLYMDGRGLPPMYVLASDSEVLLDDTLLLVRRLREAGAEVKLEVWPTLPHAFPLFESMFPEVAQAWRDIAAFMAEHLAAAAPG